MMVQGNPDPNGFMNESCAVYRDHTHRNLRAPTDDEIGAWRRRRLEETSGEKEMSATMCDEADGACSSDAAFRPYPACLVYHCFEGDERCHNPSGQDKCLRWSHDDNKCLEPACMLLDEDEEMIVPH